MSRYGFSGTEADMRKLILHILSVLGEPMGAIELLRLALIDENADYFIYSDALNALLDAELVGRKAGFYLLNPRGAEIARTMERELPAALRRIVETVCEQVRDKQLRSRCIHTDIRESEGIFYFTGSLTDGIAPLMDIQLQTGNDKQAEALCRRFEEKAEVILEALWSELT